LYTFGVVINLKKDGIKNNNVAKVKKA